MEKRNKISFIVSAALLLIFLLAILNRTGSLILLWKEEPLGSITHDEGFGYYAFVRDENISKLGLPFYLKEDETVLFPDPLSVNEDITSVIKESGGGRYHLMENNDLYFSAADNEPEAHEYKIISPLIIRSRYLLLLGGLTGFFLTVTLLIRRKTRNISAFRHMIRLLSVFFLLLMLLPWNQQTFSAAPAQISKFLIKPLLQRNAVFLGLFIILLLVDCLFCGRSPVLTTVSVMVLIFNTVYYFLPEWNWYGERADSPAYLEHYTASSIRTPGYPVFIETVFQLGGSDGLAKLRERTADETDENLKNGTVTDSYGLLTVVRAQKCFLGAVFLILFAVYCRWYPPQWFACAAQIILSTGFLGVDNSYIMTECLSQAMLLLITALLLFIIKEKNATAFFLMCILSAAAILIRPANIFLGLPLLISLIILIRSKQRPWILLTGCLIFALLCAIPAITIYSQYHTFVWMPTSGYVEIARAVDLLTPQDEAAFTDPESQAFFTELLNRKAQYPGADQNTNMWQVAEASAEALGYDRITCSPLFSRVSRTIFMLHFREFTASLTDTIQTALNRTRLQIGAIPFTSLLLLFTALSLIRHTTDSWIGMLLTLMHVSHLIISMVNQPERRYIYSTEILCILGWLLIFIDLICSLPRGYSGKMIREEP